MRINPYLIFNGNCREAFTFYEQALQGKLEAMMTFGETPPPNTYRKSTTTWSSIPA